MTGRCTCLAAWPPLHTGTQVRLNITVSPPLSFASCCNPHPPPQPPPHMHTPKPRKHPHIHPPVSASRSDQASLTLSASHLIPFYRNRMTLQLAAITNMDLLAPERWPSSVIHSDYSGVVGLYESIFRLLENRNWGGRGVTVKLTICRAGFQLQIKHRLIISCYYSSSKLQMGFVKC